AQNPRLSLHAALPISGANAVIDPLTGLPIAASSATDAEAVIRTCHPHVPQQISAIVPEEILKAYKLIHCLSSNEVLVQLQDAYRSEEHTSELQSRENL